MDYGQAVQFHEDIKKYGSILGLDSIRALMHELGDVWKDLKIIHIAGTNGKGSVCCFLASVLKAAGYLTGQFNSPAVFGLREVYQINGKWIGEEEYAACMEETAAACKRVTAQGRPHPTVFEVETALAFLYFFHRKCDIVLLETGMGGAEDATNLIQKPLCTVITSIGMDHMQFLGNSLEEIAEKKAGIIKANCPVITTGQQAEAERVLRRYAKRCHAAYYTPPKITGGRVKGGRLCFFYPGLGEVKLSMTGSYQAENAALAIKTIQVLNASGYFFTEKQILQGMEAAKWDGRFECLSHTPLFYIDGAHNGAAAEELKKSLRQNFPAYRRIGIIGVMADKPYEEMIGILKDEFDMVYTVTPKNPRALAAETLTGVFLEKGVLAETKQSVYEAVEDACKAAEEAEGDADAMVIAFGSLYYLKEVKNAFYYITGN